MSIRKGRVVRVAGEGTKKFPTPVRYLGRTGVVIKKDRSGLCEVMFPAAHRITPLVIPATQLEIK